MEYIIDGKIFSDKSGTSYPVAIEDILNQVRDEYDSGWDFAERKRELFETRMKLYANISDTENKIYVRLLYSVMQTLLSLYYTDVPTVKFYGRTLGDEDLAENINNVAKFDYEEMELAKKKYQVQRDKIFYGVGIELYEGFDEDRQVPLMKVMSPMVWIPDPYAYLGGDERFHGFELECNLDDLKEEDGRKNVDELLGKTMDDLNKDLRDGITRTRKLNTLDFDKLKKQIIYYHYTIIEKKKYLVVTDASRSIILKFVSIQPSNKAQRKNPELVKFPVIVRHWSPLYGDPYGVCLPDIMEDKQMMMQLFMNLNRIKAENEARGDIFFYDEDAIKDISKLQIPTQGPKYVKANLRINPDPIKEVQRSQIKADAMNMPQILQSQATVDLGIDERTMGVSPANNMTATENQRVQKNANLRFLLGAKIDGWAEKEFWKQRYAMYQVNYKVGCGKAFRLGSAIGSNYFDLKRNDFITDSDIDVEVLSESQANDQSEKEKIGLMAMYNGIMSNPEAFKFSKNFATRRVLKLNGVPDDVIKAMVPSSAEELSADEDVELINNGKDIKPITNLDEDHWTFLIKYDRAVDNDAKFRAIEARKKALIESGQSQRNPLEQQTPNQGNQQMGAMLTNNMIQQQNSQVGQAQSSQDVMA